MDMKNSKQLPTEIMKNHMVIISTLSSALPL